MKALKVFLEGLATDSSYSIKMLQIQLPTWFSGRRQQQEWNIQLPVLGIEIREILVRPSDFRTSAGNKRPPDVPDRVSQQSRGWAVHGSEPHAGSVVVGNQPIPPGSCFPPKVQLLHSSGTYSEDGLDWSAEVQKGNHCPVPDP